MAPKPGGSAYPRDSPYRGQVFCLGEVEPAFVSGFVVHAQLSSVYLCFLLLIQKQAEASSNLHDRVVSFGLDFFLPLG